MVGHLDKFFFRSFKIFSLIIIITILLLIGGSGIDLFSREVSRFEVVVTVGCMKLRVGVLLVLLEGQALARGIGCLLSDQIVIFRVVVAGPDVPSTGRVTLVAVVGQDLLSSGLAVGTFSLRQAHVDTVPVLLYFGQIDHDVLIHCTHRRLLPLRRLKATGLILAMHP